MARGYSRRAMLALAAGAPAAALWGHSRPSQAAAAGDIVDEGDAFRGGWSSGLAFDPADRGLLRAGPAGGVYISPGRSLARPTTHAGIHWLSDGVTVSYRQGSGSWTWTDWREVHVERTPTVPGGETWGSLVHIEDRRLIQYRAEFEPGAFLRRMTISAIAAPVGNTSRMIAGAEGEVSPGRVVAPEVTGDPGTDLVGPYGVAVGPASGATLEVVPREAWGADESNRFSEKGERWHEMFVPVRQLVVHHTVSRTEYGPGEAAADVRAIYEYHANVQGWGDIGYNALIDRWGAIYEGRHSRGGDPGDAIEGRSLINADVSGGHTKWHNYGSAGVALLGDSESPDWGMYGPSGPMWESLVEYAAFVCREGNLRPVAIDGYSPALNDFLRSDNAWHLDSASIDGHYASEATLCPGPPVVALLPELRRAVFERLGETSRSGVILVSALPVEREAKVGTPLSAVWAPEPPEPGWSLVAYEYRWEAWFKPEEEDDIDYLNGYSNDSQPLARWQPAPAGLTYAAITPWTPGQYTVQVRAIVRRANETRPAAFKAARTWLVT